MEYELIEGDYIESEPERLTGVPALYDPNLGKNVRIKQKYGEAREWRRLAVSILMARGATAQEIEEKLVDIDLIDPKTGLPFPISTIRSDMKWAKEEWKRASRAQSEEIVARIMAELTEVKRMAWARGDLSSVLNAIDRESKVLGLYAPERVQLIVNERAKELAEATGVPFDQLMKVAKALAEGKTP